MVVEVFHLFTKPGIFGCRYRGDGKVSIDYRGSQGANTNASRRWLILVDGSRCKPRKLMLVEESGNYWANNVKSYVPNSFL